MKEIPHTIIWGVGSKINKFERKKSEINWKFFWLESCGQLPLKWICNIARLNLDERCPWLMIGHLCLLCSKDVLYVLRSHKWPLLSIFLQDLIADCKIFIWRVIARNFQAKKNFHLFLIFFAQTCSDLFIFEPKPQIIVWGIFSTQF